MPVAENNIYSTKQLIKLRELKWAKHQDINKDYEYRYALAKAIAEQTPQGQKLLKEIRHDESLMIELFFVIDNKEGDEVPFFVNEAQKRLRDHYRVCQFNGWPFRVIVPKGRQQGVSSWVTALQLSIGIINKNFQGYTVADEDDSTNNIFEKAKSYYSPLPEHLKPTEKYNNRKEFRWAKEDGGGMNSSWGISTAGNTSKDGRVANSFTIHFLHASEVGWWPRIDKTLSGLTDACTPNADIVLESTGNGYNEFQERCQKAKEGKSKYKLIFIEWFIQEEYKREFMTDQDKEEFIRNINDSERKIFKNLRNYRDNILLDKFGPEITYKKLWWYYRKYVDDKNEDLTEMQQEYPTTLEEAFQSSGNPAFNIHNVKSKLLTAKKEEPIKAYNAIPFIKENTDSIKDKVTFDYVEVPIDEDREWEEADILAFKEPSRSFDYVCGADVADEGDDYCSASIFPVQTYEQAIQIHGDWAADVYAYLLYEWCEKYNWPYLGIENNNMGNTTNNKIYKDLNYPSDKFHFRVDEETRNDKKSKKLGWWTGNNKFLMIDEFRTAAINSKDMTIYDYQTFSECMTYIRDDKGSYNAESGKHDDRIMDKAISWQLRKYYTSNQAAKATTSDASKLGI